jgi:hypothetical protein
VTEYSSLHQNFTRDIHAEQNRGDFLTSMSHKMDTSEIHKQLRLVVFRDTEKVLLKNGGSLFEVGIPDLTRINPGEYASLSASERKIIANKLSSFKRLSEEGYQNLGKQYQENKQSLLSLTALFESLAMNKTGTETIDADDDYDYETADDDVATDPPDGPTQKVRFPPESILKSPTRTRTPPRTPPRTSARTQSSLSPPNLRALANDFSALSLEPSWDGHGRGTKEYPYITIADLNEKTLSNPYFLMYKAPIEQDDKRGNVK